MVAMSASWVEVGAGTGYWADQLLKAGASAVVAVDVHPPDQVTGSCCRWDGTCTPLIKLHHTSLHAIILLPPLHTFCPHL